MRCLVQGTIVIGFLGSSNPSIWADGGSGKNFGFVYRYSPFFGLPDDSVIVGCNPEVRVVSHFSLVADEVYKCCERGKRDTIAVLVPRAPEDSPLLQAEWELLNLGVYTTGCIQGNESGKVSILFCRLQFHQEVVKLPKLGGVSISDLWKIIDSFEECFLDNFRRTVESAPNYC